MFSDGLTLQNGHANALESSTAGESGRTWQIVMAQSVEGELGNCARDLLFNCLCLLRCRTYGLLYLVVGLAE